VLYQRFSLTDINIFTDIYFDEIITNARAFFFNFGEMAWPFSWEKMHEKMSFWGKSITLKNE
jgi:hypothetical protein